MLHISSRLFVQIRNDLKNRLPHLQTAPVKSREFEWTLYYMSKMQENSNRTRSLFGQCEWKRPVFREELPAEKWSPEKSPKGVFGAFFVSPLPAGKPVCFIGRKVVLLIQWRHGNSLDGWLANSRESNREHNHMSGQYNHRENNSTNHSWIILVI